MSPSGHAQDLKQCFRCQRFNHTFAGCNLSPQCVICAGGHSHKECPVRQEARTDPSKLKCANCGGTGHLESCRGCVSYKTAQENFENPKKKKRKPAGEKINLCPEPLLHKKLQMGCLLAQQWQIKPNLHLLWKRLLRTGFRTLQFKSSRI